MKIVRLVVSVILGVAFIMASPDIALAYDVDANPSDITTEPIVLPSRLGGCTVTFARNGSVIFSDACLRRPSPCGGGIGQCSVSLGPEVNIADPDFGDLADANFTDELEETPIFKNLSIKAIGDDFSLEYVYEGS